MEMRRHPTPRIYRGSMAAALKVATPPAAFQHPHSGDDEARPDNRNCEPQRDRNVEILFAPPAHNAPSGVVALENNSNHGNKEFKAPKDLKATQGQVDNSKGSH